MPKPPKSGIRGVMLRKDGKYYATWVDSTGEQQEKQCQNKTQAAAVAERGRDQARLERLMPEIREARERKQTTLGQVLDDLEPLWRRKASARDDDRYARYWRDELGAKPVTSITSMDVSRYRSRRLAEGKSAATVNRAVSFLRWVFNQIAGVVPVNPAGRGQLEQLPEENDSTGYLFEDDQPKLMEVLTAENRRRVEFAVCSGLRSANQWSMRREHVDLAGSLLSIPKAKGKKSLSIPLSPRMVELLREQLASHASPWVWPGRDGEPYRVTSANQMLKRACARAGIRILSWHKLRHTFGTRAVQRADIRTVQEAMGHSSVTVTERYTKVTGQRIRELFEGG